MVNVTYAPDVHAQLHSNRKMNESATDGTNRNAVISQHVSAGQPDTSDVSYIVRHCICVARTLIRRKV